MAQQMVATYISDPGVSPELHQELQQIFDTYKVFPEVDVTADYISLVPDSSWALGLDPLEIWTRHQRENAPKPEYCQQPVVILDAQTVRDRTVLIVADFENEDEVSEVGILRIAPPMVQLVASNLEIVNQTIDEVSIAFTSWRTL